MSKAKGPSVCCSESGVQIRVGLSALGHAMAYLAEVSQCEALSTGLQRGARLWYRNLILAAGGGSTLFPAGEGGHPSTLSTALCGHKAFFCPVPMGLLNNEGLWFSGEPWMRMQGPEHGGWRRQCGQSREVCPQQLSLISLCGQRGSMLCLIISSLCLGMFLLLLHLSSLL